MKLSARNILKGEVIKVVKESYAVIKASNVMVAVD